MNNVYKQIKKGLGFKLFSLLFFTVLSGSLSNAQSSFMWLCSSSPNVTFVIPSTSLVTSTSFGKSNEASSTALIDNTNPNSSGSGGDFFQINAVSGGFSSTSSSYFDVTFTPTTGYYAKLQNIVFNYSSVSSGANSVKIRTSADSYGSDIGSGSLTANGGWFNNLSINLSGIAASSAVASPITLRIYIYGGSTSGITKIDDIAITLLPATCNLSLPSASQTGLTQQCVDGNWTYYGNANGNFFAIDKTAGSMVSGETVDIEFNSGGAFISTSSNGTNQEHASYILGKSWNVNGTINSGGTVKIRVPFDYNDTTSLKTARDNAYNNLKTSGNPNTLAVKSNFEWFKTDGVAYNSTWRSLIVGNKFPTNHIKLTPTYSSNYVEFSGITSFSGGSGGYGYGPPNSSGTSVGLPVTWAGFDVKATEIGNELVWKTASEKNTDYFQVEYSYDGSAFTTLANKITAAGNSVDLKTYNFTHSDFATYVYYRIKQVDLDGRVDYSQIKYVKRSALSTFKVSVYPVPMKEDNIVNVKISSADKSTLSIRLTDITGKVIKSKSFTPQAETVLESYDMSPLTNGIYFIEVKNGQGREIIKIAR